MMKRPTGILAALIVLILLPISSNSLAPVPFAKYFFGLSLATGPHSQLYSCFLIKEFEGKIISSDGLTMDQFILQASGKHASKANPDGENMFEKFKVTSCMSWQDSAQQVMHYRCDPLSELWKLRFYDYPFATEESMGQGWAEDLTKPSERQLLLLTNYGIEYLTDLCYGDDAFRLLRDMADPDWVDNYRRGY